MCMYMYVYIYISIDVCVYIYIYICVCSLRNAVVPIALHARAEEVVHVICHASRARLAYVVRDVRSYPYEARGAPSGQETHLFAPGFNHRLCVYIYIYIYIYVNNIPHGHALFQCIMQLSVDVVRGAHS